MEPAGSLASKLQAGSEHTWAASAGKCAASTFHTAAPGQVPGVPFKSCKPQAGPSLSTLPCRQSVPKA